MTRRWNWDFEDEPGGGQSRPRRPLRPPAPPAPPPPSSPSTRVAQVRRRRLGAGVVLLLAGIVLLAVVRSSSGGHAHASQTAARVPALTRHPKLPEPDHAQDGRAAVTSTLA